jgi:hypothetical protein
MPLRVPLLLALLLAAAIPATAEAGRSTSHLWSTINVCDTESKPDAIGIRARMPGDGTRRRMWMRFRTQFYSDEDFAWKYVTSGGRSPWVEVGSAIFAFKETGYEFTFRAPQAGSSFLLRGVVEFQWRSKGGKVVRRTRKFTAAGSTGRRPRPRRVWSSRSGSGSSAEQARVVGDHAVDPDRLEPGDLALVVDRPDVELAAGALDRVDQAG